MVDDITTTAATNGSVAMLRLVRDETTGAVLDVAHDSKGRISTVVMSVPGTPEVNTTATYTYDSNGCLVGVVVGGGDATALTWAAPHQLALVSNTDGVASRFTYEAGTGFAVQRTRTDNTLQRMSGLGVPYSHVHDAGTVPIVFPAFPETPSLWPGSELFAGMPNASVHALLDKDFYVSGLSAGSRSQLLTNSGFGFKVHRVESSLSSLTQTYVCCIHSPCLHAAKRLPICWLLSLPHFCASAPSQQSACLLLRFDSLGLTRLHTSNSVSRTPTPQLTSSALCTPTRARCAIRYRADGLESVSPGGQLIDIEINTSSAAVDAVVTPSGALFEYEYDAIGRVTAIVFRGEPYREFTCVSNRYFNWLVVH
jgi:YD repeat-containing protein